MDAFKLRDIVEAHTSFNVWVAPRDNRIYVANTYGQYFMAIPLDAQYFLEIEFTWENARGFSDDVDTEIAILLDNIQKFLETPLEKREGKYYVQIAGDRNVSSNSIYLAKSVDQNGEMTGCVIGVKNDIANRGLPVTVNDIEKMKEYDEIAIDWDKAKLIPEEELTNYKERN